MRTLLLVGSIFFATTAAVAAQAPSVKADLLTQDLAIGANALIEVGITNTSAFAQLGVYFGLPSIDGSLVFLGGTPFYVPIESPALVAHTLAPEGRSHVAFLVPNDPSLLGLEAMIQAVVVDGYFLALAKPILSGPIIEDSIQ